MAVDQDEMEHLNIEFEQFDAQSGRQMFIDKESAIHNSFDDTNENQTVSGSADDLLEGSVNSIKSHHRAQLKQICGILDLPPARRTHEQLDSIMPYFRSLEAFTKLE